MKQHKLSEAVPRVDWAASGRMAAFWWLTAQAFGYPVANRAVFLVPVALAAWFAGLDKVWTNLNAARGGWWGPWCGFREYWRQVVPVVFGAAFFFALWALGRLAWGLA